MSLPIVTATAGLPAGELAGPDRPGMRFGLTDGQPRTLEEIGKVHGITRERIRQIEAKALSKLRHPTHQIGLRDYL